MELDKKLYPIVIAALMALLMLFIGGCGTATELAPDKGASTVSPQPNTIAGVTAALDTLVLASPGVGASGQSLVNSFYSSYDLAVASDPGGVFVHWYVGEGMEDARIPSGTFTTAQLATMIVAATYPASAGEGEALYWYPLDDLD